MAVPCRGGRDAAARAGRGAARGHAVEARLYAEDPERGFLPSTGKLAALEFSRARASASIPASRPAREVSPYYDPMIAKVIAHAPTRERALERLAEALGRTVVAGRAPMWLFSPRSAASGISAPAISTPASSTAISRPWARCRRKPIRRRSHRAWRMLLERESARVASRRDPEVPASPWDTADGFQLAGRARCSMLVVGGRQERRCPRRLRRVRAVGADGRQRRRSARERGRDRGRRVFVLRKGRQTRCVWRNFESIDVEHADGDGIVRAPMHGKVLAMLVEKGAAVTKASALPSSRR